MLPDTHPTLVAFIDILNKHNVPPAYFDYYKKWLRYFLDFCEKHPQIEDQSEQVRLYLEKLQSKQQSPQYCRQAAHAVSLFFKMNKKDDSVKVLTRGSNNTAAVSMTTTRRFAGVNRPAQFFPAGAGANSEGAKKPA